MKFGTPWSQLEVGILLKSSTAFEAQVNLKAAGFNRSMEGIRRKCKRLGAVHKQEGSLDKLFGAFQDFPLDEENHNTSVKPVKWITGSLDLKTYKPTKFIMLNDVHVPDNIPLENIWEFCEDFQPDYLLLVGDIINNDAFSHWDKKSPLRFKSMPQPKSHYEECNKIFFRPARDAVGQNCKIVYWIGNHEDWTRRAIAEMPEGQGYWEVENNIENIDMWVESKGIANLGKLYFMHGDFINSSNGAAGKIVNLFHRSIRVGHFHSLQEQSHSDLIDVEDRHTARVCGTLQKFNPTFMGNRPHNWSHNFTYGYVMPNGIFFDHTTTIVKNSFMANGKLYGIK